MSSFIQRLIDCKALLWALLGVFLLGFGSIGLTMCSDGSRLKHMSASLSAERDGLLNKQAGLISERDSLSTELTSGRESYSLLEGKHDGLQGQYDSLQGDYDGLQTNFATLEGSYADLQGKYTTLQGDYGTLEARIAEYNTLEADHADLQARYDALQTEASTARNSFMAMPQQMPVDNGRTAILQQEVNSHLKAIGSLEGSLERADRDIQVLETRKAELEAEIVELEGINVDLSGRNDNLQIEIDRFSNMEPEVIVDDEALKVALADLETKTADYDAIQLELDGVKGEFEGLTVARDTAVEDNEALRASLRDRSEEVSSLESQLTVMRRENGEQVDGLNTTIEGLNVELDGLRGERESLMASLSGEKETLSSELSGLQVQLGERDTTITGLQGEIATLQTSIADRDTSITGLQGELDGLRASLGDKDAVSAELDTLRGNNDALNSELDSLRATLSDRESSVASLTDSNTTLTAELDALRSSGSDASALLSQEQSRTADLSAQLASLQANYSELEGLRGMLDSSRAETATVTAELEALRLSGTDANSLLADEQARSADLNARLTSLQSNYATLESQYLSLQSQPVQVVDNSRDELRSELIAALGDDVVVNPDGSFYLASNVTFAKGSALISPQGRDVLDRAASAINNYLARRPDAQGKILVEGHTDSDPISTAQFPSNWVLGSTRASNVVNYFVTRGVPADRLGSVSYSDTQPIDASGTSEAMAKNRRIEFDYRP